ncbi:MAG TPA: polysaccharide biosynthesis tyrosine autokinase [Pyrinomonadaceae bacterium]|jgi:capsular exopolysaccharide synthesis family protein|nr:polysaccharide biosynthesis tyrosine autokinase [Pyrinomonadaceae bacterium]
MISEDNRLLPLSLGEQTLDRPLRNVPTPKSYGVSASDSVNLRDYVAVVLKRKWLILSLILVVTSLVTIQQYRLPSIYEAVTTIQIEPQQRSILQTQQVVINADTDPKFWQTQLELLKNPTLARQVTLTLDLQHNPAFFDAQSQTSIYASLRRIFSREKPAAAQPPTSSVDVIDQTEMEGQQLSEEERARLVPYEDTLAANLKVDPVPGTNLVNLRYTHTDPVLAQKIANTMGDVFVLNNMMRQSKGSQNAYELLSREIADLQLKIKRSSEEQVNYAKEHNLPQVLNPEADLEGKRLATLSAQLLEAENTRKNLQSLYEAASKETDLNTIPEVQDNKRIQELRNRLDILKQKRDELLVTYKEEWPEVKRVDQQISQLEEALRDSPREVVSAMKKRYESAVAQENMLRQSYMQQRAVTSQQNVDLIALGAIRQELETNKQILNTLLQRQRELQITGGDRPNNVSVATTARVPSAPIGPQRTRNIFLALMLSLAAGVGLAFLLDYLDDTLKSVTDVDRYIHLPTLAVIPALRAESRLRLKVIGGGAAAENPDKENTALALINDVRSPVAEAYRHLRTSLLLSSAGQPPKTILVTSSQASEGKTTTAVNTAIMLGHTGAEVLVVDCDLRRPRLHSHFKVPNVRGITNYLSGETDLDALLQTFEQLPNLKILTSGPVPPNPAELLGSNEMRKLLTELGERFTHVIIDSPPAISFTDASILSTMVDGVMLVVHSGRSSRAVVRRAKQQLMDVGANIFGVVLNNVQLESQEFYYASYYASYYTSDDDALDEGPGATDVRGSN